MMSSFFASTARRLGVLTALVALAPVALGQAPRGADEPDAGGLFTTPGYPQRNLPQGVGPGGQPGANVGAQPTQIGGRPGGANGNNAVNPRNGRDPNDAFPRRAEPAPPPKPNEFQRFVEGATGRLLPIFGQAFFGDAADNFQSLDNVPVSADYTIGPGDEIVTRAWGGVDVDYRSTVDRNGMLNLPKVGSFNVAGVKAADLEKNLRAQIGRLFTNFDLSVSLGQLRGLRVFVVGPATRPGVVTLSSQSTLLSAVVAAGGPSPSGSMRKILLRRDGKLISELDVYEFLVQGDKSKDVQLVAGDVVVFQPAGPRVALTGSIDTPAIYELKSAQEPIREVLRYAGGAPVLANPNRVQLERIDPAQPLAKRFVETFRLDSTGLQTSLRDGDVVTLLAISPQFANAVTLKGHVAQPLRYPFTPGMRIRDLIPDRDALITPDFYRRKNLLVQVIEDDERARQRDESDRAADGSTRGGRSASDFAQGVGGSPDARSDARSDRRNDPRDPGGADRFAPDRNAIDRTMSDRSRSERSAIREEDRAAAARARRTPSALFDELNWDYATIERLNADLSTQVIAFNLGKAVLQGDEANNIALAAGDVVTVYSQKDVRVPVARQTRLASLEGEVNAPGIYQLQAGETLKSLIARAGGFTAQAYVYGLDLSREETRVRQRENLATAMSRLEALSAVQAARDAANRRDDPTGAASTTVVSNAATQAQLARLSRVQPNGRIALELTPEIRSIDALPDLPLEHGDRISVPPRPGFVTVAGAVVNSNAFVWKPGRTAGDYLRLAGADEAADTSNMFILRADGTVNSAVDRRGFFGRGGLESQVLQPGDALVVPNQLDFETWGRALVRNLKDFAQIVSGFGIGIAAIHALNN
ncbi:MAG: SLBB domain-containing protein [Pseudomonadota bacterium]|nr:SLBB domain-containing protein [Pseudomonadota bacterium]